ncbi:MAG TPA: peptidylprolyl isomerase [Xanthobacteraceae bacterium]|nr:peptidylprolyl isomerase [Xanthobacteraceae bacterium]
MAEILTVLCHPAAAQAPRTPSSPATVTPAPTSRPAEAVKSSEVIARLGTSDVTAEELRAVIATLEPRQQAALAHDPTLLSQAVRTILGDRLVLKEALAKKWEQQPSVAAQIERARENVIIESYLRSVTTPPEGYPTDEEIKAVYDANATAFLIPRRFELAQITVALPKGADKATDEKARRKLDELMRKLKLPGANFAALAKAESDDSESAEKGGEIGWLTEAQLRPEIRNQVTGLAKAAITDPIRLDDGWHILKLLDTEAAHARPLGEVRDALAQRMRAERADASRRAYVADLLKQSPPIVNELALSKLLAAPAPEPAR